MAVTIQTTLTTLYDAETTTGWSAGTLYSGFQREGNNCLGGQASEGSFEAVYTLSSPVTIQSYETIYSWMQAWGNPETKANGGFAIVVGDGTNRVAYHVGGSDDYGFQVGAWSCFALSPSNLPTAKTQLLGTADPDFSAVTEIGVRFTLINKVIGNIDNVFWDICRYGSGLIIYASDPANPGNFAEIAADDASTAAGKAYGIVREIQPGVYGVQGQLYFYNSSLPLYFEDRNAVIIMENRGQAQSSFYVQLNSFGSNTNDFQFTLGDKLGTGDSAVGINGVSFLAADPAAMPWGLIVYTNSNNPGVSIGFYGCTFSGLSNVSTLGDDGALADFASATIDNSYRVQARQATVVNSIISNSRETSVGALELPSGDTHNVRNCRFISNPRAVEITAAGTYTFDALRFSGNTYDVQNSSGGDVTVNAINGSDPTTTIETAGGTTTINNLRTHTLTGMVPGSEVTYVRKSDGVVLFNVEDVDSTGTTQYQYNYTGDVDVTILVFHVNYYPVSVDVTLTSTDATLPIQQEADLWYSNPP